MLILIFIHMFDYFVEIPDGLLLFYLVITTLVLDGLGSVLKLMCKTMEVQG